MKEIKLKTFTLRTESGQWLGQVIISSDGMFSGVTDYGNLSYAWRSFGDEDFREFLCRLDAPYFGGKLQNGLSFVTYNKSTQRACDLFAEKILPVFQKVLKQDLLNNIKWD